MKKRFVGLLAMASMLFATSCSQEEVISQSTGNEVVVKFTTELRSDVKSRTIGAGTEGIDQLFFAVYDENEKHLIDLDQTITSFHDAGNGKKTATVEVTLVKGQTYSFAFWAQKSIQGYDSPYTFDATSATVAINYKKANDKLADAFFGSVNDYTVNGSFTQEVTLSRPFAQVNFLTTGQDLGFAKKAGFVPVTSSVTISKVANQLNLLDGAVEGNDDVTFEMNQCLKDETTNITGVTGTYYYLATAYILPNKATEESTITASTTIVGSAATEAPITLTARDITAQRNYRTNIYGNLLTENGSFNVTIDPAFGGDQNFENPVFNVVAKSLADVETAFAEGGNIILDNDIEFEKIVAVESGKEVYLNLNGKTITVDENTASNTLLYVKDGGKLIIDGNGTINLGAVSTMAVFAPYGELVIENGTFIRDKVTTVTNKTTGLFMGAKTTNSNVTINGGYFDAGYYNEDAADIEELLAGTKTLEETEDDIAKRNNSKDANKVRVAIKENVSILLNHSGYGEFKIYGGTFVGANPAWGDEGCMLPTTPNYLRPWSYYQGGLLDGQTFNENGIVLPEGYTITQGATAAGIPTYTVTYNK